MLFCSLSCDLLRVVFCKLQIQCLLEPPGQGAPGCGPVPGAVARTPLFCRLTGFQAPPPPGPADLRRPSGLEPRRPERAPGRPGGGALMSYLLFESSYTKRLIELGYADTMQRNDEVIAFFKEAQA